MLHYIFVQFTNFNQNLLGIIASGKNKSVSIVSKYESYQVYNVFHNFICYYLAYMCSYRVSDVIQNF